jgi:hypothetical protein
MNSILLYISTMFLIATIGLIVIVTPMQVERLKQQTDDICSQTDRLKDGLREIRVNRRVLRRLKRSYLKSFLEAVRNLIRH